MRNLLITISFIVLLSSCSCLFHTNIQSVNLDLLLNYMEGSFSSEEQAKEDSSYFHITLDMKRIWNDRTDGVWLYVEQTAASTPGEPYRQRIYHLEQISENKFKSTICSFDDPKKYIGGHLNPEIFNDIYPESIEVLTGCGLILEYKNGKFKGSTVEGECINSWGDATYATSEVSISKGLMISWDRGWNDKKEQVWGVEKGGYRFRKI